MLGLLVCGAPEQEVRALFPREVEDILAEGAGLLEEKRRRRLRPDDEVRPLGGRGAREVTVSPERLVLIRGIPLVVLLDVALDERDAEMAGAAVREARGTAAAREWHDGHEECQQHEHGDEAPEPRAALGDHRQRHDVEQHDNRRDAVHAGHLGELREVVVPILAIAERRPRKA